MVSLTITPFIPSQAQTNQIVPADRITKLTPTWTITNPASQTYTIEASNDSGATWEELTSGTEHEFSSEPTYGILFRIRFYTSE